MRFTFGAFQLDQDRFTLTGPSGPVHVEPQVYEVLRYLIEHRERVVTKEELLDSIWGSRFVSESALTSRIKAARRAVDDDGQAQRVIKTVHGRGYQFVADLQPSGSGAGATATTAHRGPLPRLRNGLIGRGDDVAEVIERLRRAQLLTITGPGGIGKTTVALAVAHRLSGDYSVGVVFVDLAPAPPGADITRAVADAAGLEGGASATLAGVADHLATRPVLVLLDNCEHVIDQAAALVDRMLETSETARVLATSREPLGVAGEHVWPLGPLIDEGPALFVERARAAEPRVEWDPAHPAVIELCRRLDSVPLALELAAGQLRRFDLNELNRRLDDRLTLLRRAVADGQRHSTMETAIDWSYQLLDGDEQALLRHLGVFPSTFDAAAVEASAPKTSSEPVMVFGQLVDKSLVVRVPGAGRYRLLETIRMFARDRLDDTAETAEAFDRHRWSVRDRVASVSRLDRWMSGPLAADYRVALDDARQAFRLTVQRGDGRDALEIAVGASFLWKNALGCGEGMWWTDELLALDLPPADEIWVHVLRADIGQGRGDHRQMFGAASAAQALAASADDPAAACLAAIYTSLGHITDPLRGLEQLALAHDLARQSGDARLLTLAEAFRSTAALAAGQAEDARATLARLERTATADGYDRFILNWAGWILGLAERDGVVARRWMDLQQEYLDRTGIVETWLTTISTAMCDALDGGDVPARLRHTLSLADWEGYQADADCVLVLAYAELCSGRLEKAAELVGAAVHGRFSATAHYALYRAVLERPLREGLDRRAFMSAKVRGRSRKAAEVLSEYGVTR